MTSPTRPLSGQQLDRLELMLDSETPGWEPMPLDMLQGFLFGIASAPREVPPDEWLPRVLGAEDWPVAQPGVAVDATAGTATETTEWIDLLVRFYHQQERALEGTEDAALVFYEDTPGVSNKFEHWCIGYLDAIDLAAAAWEAAGDPAEIDELLFPFHVLANALPPAERERFPDKEWAKLLQECGDDLWPAIMDARKYGLALRNRPTTVKRAAPKPGRNDRCACGSGKKFKACCGKA